MDLLSSQSSVTKSECEYFASHCEEFTLRIMDDLSNPDRLPNFYSNMMMLMIHYHPNKLTSLAFVHRALYYADMFNVNSGLFSWFLTNYIHNDEAYHEILQLDDFPSDHLAVINSFRKVEIFWDLIDGHFTGIVTPYLYNCISLINRTRYPELEILVELIGQETESISQLDVKINIGGKFNNIFGYNLHRLLQLPNSAISMFATLGAIVRQITDVEDLLNHLPIEDMNIRLIDEIEKVVNEK